MARERSKDKAAPAEGLETIENKAALLDALPECVFLVGEGHVVLSVNSTGEDMLGRSFSEIVGLPLKSAISMLADGDGHALDVETSVDRCMASGEAELLEGVLRPGDRNAASPDKELSKAYVTVMPVSSGDETKQVGVVISGRAVRHSYALRDAVLSMVSHELRTPLLHIKGFVSTLLESDIQWDEETRLDFLHTIDREADRLTSMVNDLMEITRMGSVDLPLHLEDADPYLLAYAAVDSASPFLRKHRVLVEIPENLPKINIDVLRVMGVLANLLQNSSKYSEDGSTIVIDAETDDSVVTFSVSDDGPGIAEKDREGIFKMFYRGDSTKKQFPGSGLGLAVCKSVIDAHGGRIWVEGAAGGGATFKFTIPFKPSRSSSSSSGPATKLQRLTDRPAKNGPASNKRMSPPQGQNKTVGATLNKAEHKKKGKRKIAVVR